MRHRANSRYRYGKHRGKTIPQGEIARRIAQSYGYDIYSAQRHVAQKQIKTTPDTNNAGDTVIIA